MSINIKILKNKIIEDVRIDLRKKNKIYTFLNCYSYFIFRKNVQVFSEFNGIYCDGIVFEKMMRSIKVRTSRVSFDMTSLAPVVFDYAQKNNETVILVGSEEGIVDKVKEHLSSEFQQLRIVDVRHGFFNNDGERYSYLTKVIEINPDYVIAGMGTPYQEKFLLDLKKLGWEGIGFTCGGFFHQTCNRGIKYYPNWMDRFNLRWAYRIWDEPKLAKRYFIYYPISIVAFYYDCLRSWVRNRL
ncbi:MAG: WecB/TagA/CpsF family glycosyltransferase [Pseudomonadota bacterium]